MLNHVKSPFLRAKSPFPMVKAPKLTPHFSMGSSSASSHGVHRRKCEQAFELSDASAERSAAGCTIKLNKEPSRHQRSVMIDYDNYNI